MPSSRSAAPRMQRVVKAQIVMFEQVGDKPIGLLKNRMNRSGIDRSLMHYVVPQFVDVRKESPPSIDSYVSPGRSFVARSRPVCAMDFALRNVRADAIASLSSLEMFAFCVASMRLRTCSCASLARAVGTKSVSTTDEKQQETGCGPPDKVADCVYAGSDFSFFGHEFVVANRLRKFIDERLDWARHYSSHVHSNEPRHRVVTKNGDAKMICLYGGNLQQVSYVLLAVIRH
jgi:hypothetical protein